MYVHSPRGGAMTRIGRAMRDTPAHGIVVNQKGEILGTVPLDSKNQPEDRPTHAEQRETNRVGCAALLAMLKSTPDRWGAIHGPHSSPAPRRLSSDWWSMTVSGPECWPPGCNTPEERGAYLETWPRGRRT